ncbi:Uncharacterized protein TCM_002141 [Theobroma cacao]|uniref:Uncharacterized protein n=1 Tax=Theobroma cacao TaxID=3641 RepID=A0A061DKJ1_THECC|nr:Uncharacterized protein TCM_002141 [Theobroma cacao]
MFPNSPRKGSTDAPLESLIEVLGGMLLRFSRLLLTIALLLGHLVLELRAAICFIQFTVSLWSWKKQNQLRQVLQACKIWREELQWAVRRLEGAALLSVILRIASSAYVYHLGRGRNDSIHA